MKAALCLLLSALLLAGSAAAAPKPTVVKLTTVLRPSGATTSFSTVPSIKSVGMYAGQTSSAFRSTICAGLIRHGANTQFAITVTIPGRPFLTQRFTVRHTGGCGAVPTAAGNVTVLDTVTGTRVTAACGKTGTCNMYWSSPLVSQVYKGCKPKTKKCVGCMAACKCCPNLLPV